MRDYSALKVVIDANINRNGRQAITGSILNSVLTAMIDSLGGGYLFMGMASPTTDPGNIDAKVFYLAVVPGRYEHMGNVVIGDGEVAIINHTEGAWTKVTTGIASHDDIEDIKDELESLLGDIAGISTELGNKMTFCELWSDGNIITMKDSETPLTFTEVKGMVDDPSLFVALKLGLIWWLLPQYDDMGGAIVFTGTSLLSAQGSVDRVAINMENRVSSYSIAIENAFLKTDDLEKEKIDNFNTYPTTHAVNAGLEGKQDIISDLETIRTEIKKVGQLELKVGELPDLVTPTKTDLVSAINEAFNNGGSGGGSDPDLKERVDNIEHSVQPYISATAIVRSTSTRNHSFPLTGEKQVITRVRKIEGGADSYNVSYVKADGTAMTIASAQPFDGFSDVLNIPSDATQIRFFIGYSGSIVGTYELEVYDATSVRGYVEKLKSVDAYDYLHDRKIYSITHNAAVSSSLVWLVSSIQGKNLALKGDTYCYIISKATHVEGSAVKFYATDGSEYTIAGREMQNAKLFKIFCDKTISAISLPANSVTQAGEIEIEVFAVEPSTEPLVLPLRKQKILCFGDSNTEFKDAITLKRYSDYLEDYSGASVYNAGVGGSRLAERSPLSLAPTDGQQAFSAFEIVNLVIAFATNDYTYQIAALNSGLLGTNQSRCERAYNQLSSISVNDIDIVTIFGGSNDYNGGSIMGEDSMTNYDKGSVFGAINLMVKTLLTYKPTLKIYAFSPLIHMYGDVFSLENSSDVYVPSDAPEGMLLPTFCEKLQKAYSRNHIPFDLWYGTIGINAYNFAQYYSDGSHLQRGYFIVADKMYKFLLSH